MKFCPQCGDNWNNPTPVIAAIVERDGPEDRTGDWPKPLFTKDPSPIRIRTREKAITGIFTK